MMADDRWVCYPLTVVQLVSIHGKNSSFPNVVALVKLCEFMQDWSCTGHKHYNSPRWQIDGNVLFYSAPPDTLDISSAWNGNLHVCFQVHNMESLFSKFAKGVQHFSIYLAREDMSGTTAVTNIILSRAADKKLWPLTVICGEGQQQQSCTHKSPDCSQASSTPCKPKEVSAVSKPEPLRPVNTVSTLWSLVIHCSFFSSWALKSPALVLHLNTPSHPIAWLELHGYKP